MGWLARIIGREPPRLPAGARAFSWDDSHNGTRWSIRYCFPPAYVEPDSPRVPGSPTFTQLVMADRYCDYVNGEGSFEYPPGQV